MLIQFFCLYKKNPKTYDPKISTYPSPFLKVYQPALKEIKKKKEWQTKLLWNTAEPYIVLGLIKINHIIIISNTILMATVEEEKHCLLQEKHSFNNKRTG